MRLLIIVHKTTKTGHRTTLHTMSYHSNEYNNLMLPTESNIGMANNKYKNLFHSKSTSSKSSRASSRKKKNDVIALTNNTNNIALGGHINASRLWRSS